MDFTRTLFLDEVHPLGDVAHRRTFGVHVGMMFWNLAITKDEKVREEMLDDLVKRTQKTEEEPESSGRSLRT